MSEVSNDEIYERLGGLAATLDGLRRDITRSDDRAQEHRDKVNDRLTNLENDVAEIKPIANEFRNLKAKAAGATLVLGFLGVILGWLFTAFAEDVKALVFRLFGIH